ncbi:cytochrome c, class I [Deinococcus geothermalis DSM 11300]|uniref:Cytochrome c, class I n=1 Tax=Deinococcus geothermalis (strain DSM 11300 / CIP 105573 / AG-3a) TaxID=319795 RepID=Q1J2G2_DEIGD|nr:cytochrome c [Deinococcus geothermalis]ABF44322.1 cytochrome c, class I [Deinococcus geothermalis DSM 11300]
MQEDRFFTPREIAAALTFVVLAVLMGAGSYRTGFRMSGGNGGAAMSASTAAAPVNGQSLYATNCAGCHGAQAQGGVGPGLGITKDWSDAAFAQAVLHGKAPEGRNLSPVMPRFGETGLDGAPATDEQINAIHAFVKGL